MTPFRIRIPMTSARTPLRAASAATAALAGGLARAEPPGSWLATPNALAPAGTGAALVEGLWHYLLVAALAVFVVVVTLLILAARHRGGTVDDPDDDPVARAREDRSVKPWLWFGTIATAVILLVTAGLTFATMARLAGDPDDDLPTIEVVGHQWWWEVRLDGETIGANELHVPVGRRVRILLRSADVIHSFWVPRLAGKIDMIPGDVNEIVIEASEPGVHRGLCAEFCGLQHANMAFVVVAESEADYRAWLDAARSEAREPVDDAAVRGEALFSEVGCAGCHAVRGTAAAGRLGPDLTRIAARRTLGAGTLPNNRGNLAGWIVDPWAHKPGAFMPPQELTGAELQDLLAYLEGLR